MKQSITSPGAAHPPRARTIIQKLAGAFAESRFMRRGKSLWLQNRDRWNLPLTKSGKLLCGGYLILRDFADGQFPPTYEDQAKAYQAEIDYHLSLPGIDPQDCLDSAMQKPFWGSERFQFYSSHFARILAIFEDIGLKRGSEILELGCGCGWTAEFLALSGYSVCATTIAPADVAMGIKRVESLRVKKVDCQLEFRVSAMEEVDTLFDGERKFDAILIYEALHHAFDWRKAIHASSRCLKPGGWLVLADEPNWFHTFKSYRVAKLSNTHEIGMNRRHIIAEMLRAGLIRTKIFGPRFENFVSAHWLAGQKSS